MLGGVGVGAGDEDAELGDVAERRPDLLAVDDVDVEAPFVFAKTKLDCMCPSLP